MATTTHRFLTNSASNVGKSFMEVVHEGSSYPAFPALQLHSPNASSSYVPNSNDSKRKWSCINGSLDLQDGSSLSLGLGGTVSSGATVVSGKEYEESSGNLGLTLNVHMGNDQRAELDCVTAKPSRIEGPKVDLELSLVSGSLESDVTTVSEASPVAFRNAKAPITSTITTTAQLVDEGSISSRWKLPLLPPSQISETITPFHHVPARGNQGVSVTRDSGLAHPQQRRNSNVKTCQFIGCTRGARGASGLCIAHGGGRRCQRDGCHKGAEGKTVFCKAHGGGRRCEYLGCTKSAEGRTDYCIGHGGGRRCSHEGCTRAARGKSGLCIRHGGGKRCKMENCTKSAEGISGLCISHGGGRRCQFPACTKGAQGSTMFCKAHGGGKRCIYLGCTKGAEGSTNFCKGHGGGKRCTFAGGCTKSVHGGTLFCVNHGGGKRCAAPECTKSARGRTNYCVRHGGGKRCKCDGCGKSAQGSTNFCKAHGGGKRCSWGQSQFGDQKLTPCDKFARGKSGLCASHSMLVQDKHIPALVLDPRKHDVQYGIHGGFAPIGYMGYEHRSAYQANSSQFALPEGRVHGGGLMAMLRGNTSSSASTSNPGKSHPITPPPPLS